MDKSQREQSNDLCKLLSFKAPDMNYFLWANAARKKRFEEKFIVLALKVYEQVIKERQKLEKPWAYLDTILPAIRTRELQGEAAQYKTGEMPDWIKALAKMGK